MTRPLPDPLRDEVAFRQPATGQESGLTRAAAPTLRVNTVGPVGFDLLLTNLF
jgi:hypothetical protein